LNFVFIERCGNLNSVNVFNDVKHLRVGGRRKSAVLFDGFNKNITKSVTVQSLTTAGFLNAINGIHRVEIDDVHINDEHLIFLNIHNI
jgi:hypothetical protein